MPHVIEPSAGADRATLAFLCEAYTEDMAPDENGKPTERVVLKLHPRLAPIKAAVFPLVKKDGMPEVAQKIYRELKPHFNVFYDEKGAVGRRYRRQDEAGTPYLHHRRRPNAAGPDRDHPRSRHAGTKPHADRGRAGRAAQTTVVSQVDSCCTLAALSPGPRRRQKLPRTSCLPLPLQIVILSS